MLHSKKEYIQFFSHMEQEEINDAPLGAQAWDEISWWFHNATEIDKYFSENELYEMFPILFK